MKDIKRPEVEEELYHEVAEGHESFNDGLRELLDIGEQE